MAIRSKRLIGMEKYSDFLCPAKILLQSSYLGNAKEVFYVV